MSIYKINVQKIEEAITQFESEVDFELVPVITPRSSFNEHVAWMLSILVFLLVVVAVEITFSTRWDSPFMYLTIGFILSFALGHWLSKFDVLNRWLISKKERNRQCFEKAQRIFFLKHLHELKKPNSLILFISVMEKKIIILPDPRLKMDGLQDLQKNLLKVVQEEFKQSHYEDGFLKAILFLKTQLRPSFPQNDQKKLNEIPNKLIWWAD